MVVGVCQVELYLAGNASLKGKRQVLRKIKDRVKHRFNISLAEVGENDRLQRALLGISVVGNEGKHVNSQLDQVINFIERMNVAQLVDYQIELIPFNQ